MNAGQYGDTLARTKRRVCSLNKPLSEVRGQPIFESCGRFLLTQRRSYFVEDASATRMNIMNEFKLQLTGNSPLPRQRRLVYIETGVSKPVEERHE